MSDFSYKIKFAWLPKRGVNGKIVWLSKYIEIKTKNDTTLITKYLGVNASMEAKHIVNHSHDILLI
jgi:hypothetical protein